MAPGCNYYSEYDVDVEGNVRPDEGSKRSAAAVGNLLVLAALENGFRLMTAVAKGED